MTETRMSELFTNHNQTQPKCAVVVIYWPKCQQDFFEILNHFCLRTSDFNSLATGQQESSVPYAKGLQKTWRTQNLCISCPSSNSKSGWTKTFGSCFRFFAPVEPSCLKHLTFRVQANTRLCSERARTWGLTMPSEQLDSGLPGSEPLSPGRP